MKHLAAAILLPLLPLAVGTARTADVPADPASGGTRTVDAVTVESVSLSPRVVVVGADADQRLWLDEALVRFAANGLELPDLEVRFFDDDAACGGHQGLFQQSFTPWRILICSDLEFVATHELAHAWEAANVDDDFRAAYVARRGLPTWNGSGFDWNERGVEDLAFVVQQNLMATDPPLTSPTWADRVAAYELITGRPSPLVKP
jgi:hypothetical protein